MDQEKGQVNNLLEEGWFFGNTLKSKSRSPKIMLRCNSDPCPSTSTMEGENSPLNTSNGGLIRAPSLPVSLGKDKRYELLEEEHDDVEEPSMGDLIRQAMPMPIPRPSRRLQRTPSLPPIRVTSDDASSNASNVQNGFNDAWKSCRKLSVVSSPLLQERAPIGIMKLSRRASIDSSLLPPRCTSKGSKQSSSNSKKKTQKNLEQTNMNTPTKVDQPKTHKMDKSKSQKSPSDLQTEELQGFKDLGFSFKSNKVSPNVTQKPPALQRRASLDSHHAEISNLRRPYHSESWRKPSSPLSAPPSVPKWGDHKASSTQDMKAQIKFWARAVASNVRQEC